jgi:hypothetical protein
LGLATIVLGPTYVWHHLRATRDQAVTFVDKSMPDEQIEAMIAARLRSLDGEIRAYFNTVGKMADNLAANEIRLEDMQKQFQAEKLLLARIKPMLEQDSTRFEVAGRYYTKDEIIADGKLHLGRCERLETQVACQQKLVQQLRKALEEGRANLAKAKTTKQDLIGELESLKTRLSNARVRQELGELAAVLDKAPLGPDSELARSMGELQDRVRRAENNADYLALESKQGGIVQWNGGATPEDVTQAINRYLQKQPNAPAPGN